MNKPILLITFNRPEYTKIVLNALKKAGVKKIYIFKDGPRPNNQADLRASEQIETLISSIDWDCTIRTNFLANNLGCGYGPFTAISWAFQYEDELIILEDDCIPSLSFFDFCTSMLNKYKNNDKIRLISGRSHYSEHSIFTQYSYIYTQYAHTLGWATWKRVWNGFDLQMREMETFFRKGGFSNQFSSSKESVFFNKRYWNDLRHPEMVFHVWDFQFGYHARMNGALGIVPSKNLIKYIGLEGTHSMDSDSLYATIPVSEDYKATTHPDMISINADYDQTYFRKFVNIQPCILKRILFRIASYFRK